MKKIFFLLCASFISIFTFAQTGANYYVPLKVGNFLKLHTVPMAEGWSQRTTVYSIDGTDMIDGQLYYRQKSTEIMDSEPGKEVIIGIFWLRQDLQGNILLGAISPNGSSNIDSAIKISSSIFPNEFLTQGFSRSYPFGIETYNDSVLSVSETVTVPTGTYTNCIKVRDMHRNAAGDITFLEYHYYAKNIGLILNTRTEPIFDSHTDQLIESKIVSSANENKGFPSSFSLEQNYPNPFNPSTTISFNIPAKSFVSLKVFDVMGKETAVLVFKELSAGHHSFNWNAADKPSGIYFYRIEAGSFNSTKKLTLIK